MSFAAAIMTPLVLVLSAPGGGEAEALAAPVNLQPQEQQPPQAVSERPAAPEFASWGLHIVMRSFEPDPAHQVSIEQRMTIRISPRSKSALPGMFVELPDHAIGPRFFERRIGECVKVARISGVQTDVGNRLLLIMNDRRIVSAMLERACRARDFYSGFYLSKSNDGKLCVARDTLQSRSGANCKITQLRELVEIGD